MSKNEENRRNQQSTKSKSPSSLEENTLDIQYACFMVDEKPYCLWDYNIPLITMKFLENVDPTYYEFIAGSFFKTDGEEINLLGSLALRTTYSQALETLFAFIGATLQAPLCAPAWFETYQIGDVKNIVKKISNGNSFPSILRDKNPSWEKVSEFIHSWLVLDDKSEENRIKTNFASLWKRFAHDFLDKSYTNEYNSIKHGLRIRPGGFQVAIGLQETPGKTAPPENMKMLGKSDYGSSFFVREYLFGKYHFQLKRHNLNWNPEDFVWGLNLISVSIQNVISALKVINGVSAKDVKFIWPSKDETIQEPWKRATQIGLRSMGGIHRDIPIQLIKPFSKDELTKMYSEGSHFLSGIRYHFEEDSEG